MTRRLAKATRDRIESSIKKRKSLQSILHNLLDDIVFDLYTHDERIVQIMDRVTKLEKYIIELEKK